MYNATNEYERVAEWNMVEVFHIHMYNKMILNTANKSKKYVVHKDTWVSTSKKIKLM